MPGFIDSECIRVVSVTALVFPKKQTEYHEKLWLLAKCVSRLHLRTSLMAQPKPMYLQAHFSHYLAENFCLDEVHHDYC